MERWIADVWGEEEGGVNFSVRKIVVEDYTDDFLDGRSFFISKELAEESARLYVEKNLIGCEMNSLDEDIPKYTQRI